jgi:bla regulator protein blaR1
MMNWFVEALVASSLLIGIILLVRRPVARYFGPRTAYALWLIPAIRMILPPLPVGTTAALSSVGLTSAAPGFAVLPILWIGGALIFFAWHVQRYRHFKRSLRSRTTPIANQGKVTISQSAGVAVPLAYGVIAKRVMLPQDFAARYSATEQGFAIDHELAHHRRGDLIANCAALGFLTFHWFSPLAHLALRAFRADQEAACDQTVLAGASSADCHAYGVAMVKSVTGSVPLMACSLSTGQGIKQRLTHIVAAQEGYHLQEGGWIIAGVFALAGLGLTASQLDMSSVPDVRAVRPLRTDIATAPVVMVSHPVPAKIAAVEHDTEILRRASPRAERSNPAAPPSGSPRSDRGDAHPAQPAPHGDVLIVRALQEIANPDTPLLASFDAAAVSCPDGSAPRASSHAVFRETDQDRAVAVFVCGKGQNAADQRATVMTGLQDARTQIATDAFLKNDQRNRLINLIDAQIETLKTNPKLIL